MSTDTKKTKSFAPMFCYVLVIDLLAYIALASKDEVWGQFAMMWTGPLDDIFYALLGVQGFLYLLDPSEEILRNKEDRQSLSRLKDLFKEGRGAEKIFAGGFLTGSAKALILLPALLVIGLIAYLGVDHAVLKGLNSLLERQLSLIVPVCAVLGLGFTFLKLTDDTTNFWRGLLFAFAGLLLVAVSDGRWQNHIFHLFNNLESLQAWFLSFAWAGFLSTLLASNEIMQPLSEQPGSAATQ